MNRQRRNYINSPQRLIQRAMPKHGTVTYQTTPNESEQHTINWLHNNIGGNITVLAPSKTDGIYNPDLLWNNVLVDIKHTAGTIRTLDTRISKAMKQTNRGGVVIDVTGTEITDEAVINTVRRRMGERNGLFAIVLKDGSLLAYIEKE